MSILRECHECGDARSDCFRRVPPATRVAGQTAVTRIVCPSCAEAQDGALVREAQRLMQANHGAAA